MMVGADLGIRRKGLTAEKVTNSNKVDGRVKKTDSCHSSQFFLSFFLPISLLLFPPSLPPSIPSLNAACVSVVVGGLRNTATGL